MKDLLWGIPIFTQKDVFSLLGFVCIGTLWICGSLYPWSGIPYIVCLICYAICTVMERYHYRKELYKAWSDCAFKELKSQSVEISLSDYDDPDLVNEMFQRADKTGREETICTKMVLERVPTDDPNKAGTIENNNVFEEPVPSIYNAPPSKN